MIRFISGIFFSSMFGLAMIGMLSPEFSKEDKADVFIGSLIIYAAPGALLTTSGHKHLKRRKTIVDLATDMSLQDRAIDIKEICIMTGESQADVVKCINQEKQKGNIPYASHVV